MRNYRLKPKRGSPARSKPTKGPEILSTSTSASSALSSASEVRRVALPSRGEPWYQDCGPTGRVLMVLVNAGRDLACRFGPEVSLDRFVGIVGRVGLAGQELGCVFLGDQDLLHEEVTLCLVQVGKLDVADAHAIGHRGCNRALV